MPLNPFFSSRVKSEQSLYEDLVVESMQIYGVETFYIPRKIVNVDTIFNETALNKFGDAYQIEQYIESVDGFEGDGNLLSKFGLEVRSQMILVMARRRWDCLVGRFQEADDTIRPKEGDLIYVPMVKGLFEIKFVDGDTPFYQLQNMPTYKLTVELFEYDNEALDTGIDAIDSFERNFASRTRLDFDTLVGDWLLDEDITQDVNGVIVTAEVAEIFDTYIEVVGISASDSSNTTFAPTSAGILNIVGADSGATANVITIDNFNTLDHDPGAQNTDFETIGGSFIDFTELNPFGEVNIV